MIEMEERSTQNLMREKRVFKIKGVAILIPIIISLEVIGMKKSGSDDWRLDGKPPYLQQMSENAQWEICIAHYESDCHKFVMGTCEINAYHA